MADIIQNGQPRPVVIYGRAPNGTFQAATTDGNGNLNASGSTSIVDKLSGVVPSPIMVYGRAPNGQLQAVTTDGTGKLN